MPASGPVSTGTVVVVVEEVVVVEVLLVVVVVVVSPALPPHEEATRTRETRRVDGRRRAITDGLPCRDVVCPKRSCGA